VRGTHKLDSTDGWVSQDRKDVTHGFWYISECFVATVSATIQIWDCLECGLPFLEPSDCLLFPLQSSDGGLRIR